LKLVTELAVTTRQLKGLEKPDQYHSHHNTPGIPYSQKSPNKVLLKKKKNDKH
jgi:hypothetical protein